MCSVSPSVLMQFIFNDNLRVEFKTEKNICFIKLTLRKKKIIQLIFFKEMITIYFRSAYQRRPWPETVLTTTVTAKLTRSCVTTTGKTQVRYCWNIPQYFYFYVNLFLWSNGNSQIFVISHLLESCRKRSIKIIAAVWSMLNFRSKIKFFTVVKKGSDLINDGSTFLNKSFFYRRWWRWEERWRLCKTASKYVNLVNWLEILSLLWFFLIARII